MLSHLYLLPALEVPVECREVLHRYFLPFPDGLPRPHVHIEAAAAATVVGVDHVPGVTDAVVRHDGEDGVESLAHRHLVVHRHRHPRRHPGKVQRNCVHIQQTHRTPDLVLREHVGQTEVVAEEIDDVAVIPRPVFVAVPAVTEVVHELVRPGPAVPARLLQEQDAQWRDDRVRIAGLPAPLNAQRFGPICTPTFR